MKHCSRCKELKPLDEFHRLRKAPDGRQYRCKKCVSELYHERVARTGLPTRRHVEPLQRDLERVKECTGCGVAKKGAEFYRRRASSDGLTFKCKACLNELNRRWTENNPEKARKAQKAAARAWRLRREFGLSMEDYDHMLAEQGGVCAICQKPEAMSNGHESGGPNYLTVDHCHATGKIRALLCFRCNSTLGKLEDDVDLMRKMLAYMLAQQT